MVGSGWIRRLGPGLAAVGGVALVASTTLGARERAWEPPPCATTGATAVAAGTTGAWYRLDPIVEAGRLVGQRLGIGLAGGSRPPTVDLPPESFAAGPFGAAILVGTDDGERSSLRLVDAANGCARTVLVSGEVIRRATLTPDGSGLVTFAVGRTDRAELGVDLHALDGGAPAERLLEPTTTDARFGPTWTTEFAWEMGADRLAVQSCGALACRTRVVDLASRAAALLDAPGVGDMIGFAGGRVVAYAACAGLPCPLVAIDVADGRPTRLAEAGGRAALARALDGRPVVAIEPDVDGGRIVIVDLDGRTVATLGPDVLGRRLVAGPGRSDSAAAVPGGIVVVGPEGRLLPDGVVPVAVRRLVDGSTLPFEEIAR